MRACRIPFSRSKFLRFPTGQSVNNWDAACDKIKCLEKRGLIELSVPMGGIRGLHVSAAQGLRDLAEEPRNN